MIGLPLRAGMSGRATLLTACATALMLVAATPALAAPTADHTVVAATATTDLDPPVLVNFEVTPTVVDVTDGSQQVTVTAHATDVTGVDQPSVWLSKWEKKLRYMLPDPMTLVSGTPQDGVFSTTVTIPETTPPGDWDVGMRYFSDILRNAGEGNGDPINTPVPLTVENRNQPDDDPPVVSDLSVSAAEVDVSDGPAEVTISVHVTDATGTPPPEFYLYNPGIPSCWQGLYWWCQNLAGPMSLTSGTPRDGIYTKTVTIPTTAMAGPWTVEIPRLFDDLGNESIEADPWTFPDQLSVLNTNPPDLEPPKVVSVDITPDPISLANGDQQVTATIHLTDDTGAKAPAFELTGPTQEVGPDMTRPESAMTRISGDAKDGTYQRTLTLPETAETGRWEARFSWASDVFGNAEPTGQLTVPVMVTRDATAVAPVAPTTVRATRGDRSARVTWIQAVDGGAPITSYRVTASPGGASKTVDGTATATTLTGLRNGTGYTFTVTATNAVGTSPASTPSNRVTPAGKPGAPTKVKATARNRSATVSWSAPSANGARITSYRVTARPGGITKTVKGTTATTVAGLQNGTGYTFTVTATNAVGTSPASTRSNKATPDGTAPTVSIGTPRPLTVLLGTTTKVRWKGSDHGGTGISSYDARWRSIGPAGRAGAWHRPAKWQRTTATTVTSPRLTAGYSYCFAVRARDRAGNTSKWTTQRCAVSPLDDRALTRHGSWARLAGSAYYRGTATSTTRKGVTLTSRKIHTRRVGIVATRCAKCGQVAVYLAGKRIGTANLYARKATHRRVILLPRLSKTRTGAVTIRALNGRKTVRIDGLIIRHR